MTLTLPDWTVDGLSFTDGRVEANGWFLPSRGNSRLTVKVNDVEADLKIIPARPDVVRAWEAVADVTIPCGFLVSAHFDHDPGALRLELYEDGRCRDLNAWFFKTRETLPIPDAARRERVCGSADQTVFLRNGFTNYQRLREIAALFLDCASGCRLLDWGCGAGSIARYVDGAWTYTGVDIDPDNIAWCQDHLGPRRFVNADLNPPMPIDSACFDVCFGVSVMTHLNEANQESWLSELARVIRPGGVCLLSLLGGQAIAKAPWLRAADLTLMQRGVMFAEDDHEIGRIVGQSNYYGTTYHLERYVRAQWSTWFEVAGYFPAALGHQDVVALRVPEAAG